MSEKYSECLSCKATMEMATAIAQEAHRRDLDKSDFLRLLIRFGFSVIKNPVLMSQIIEHENIGFNHTTENNGKR